MEHYVINILIHYHKILCTMEYKTMPNYLTLFLPMSHMLLTQINNTESVHLIYQSSQLTPQSSIVMFSGHTCGKGFVRIIDSGPAAWVLSHSRIPAIDRNSELHNRELGFEPVRSRIE